MTTIKETNNDYELIKLSQEIIYLYISQNYEDLRKLLDSYQVYENNAKIAKLIKRYWDKTIEYTQINSYDIMLEMALLKPLAEHFSDPIYIRDFLLGYDKIYFVLTNYDPSNTPIPSFIKVLERDGEYFLPINTEADIINLNIAYTILQHSESNYLKYKIGTNEYIDLLWPEVISNRIERMGEVLQSSLVETYREFIDYIKSKN